MKPLWTSLWSFDVPSKICNFLWRSCRNSLPTKDNLMQRKVIPKNLREQCKCHQEDVLHALYGCPKLEPMWNKKQQWNHNTLRQAKCFTDLLGIILQKKMIQNYFVGWFGIYGIEGTTLSWGNLPTLLARYWKGSGKET